MTNDGALIKERTRPEVYLVQVGRRHWIPDPATLTSKWTWAQVQTLPDIEVEALPLGDPVPSVIDPGTWPDGALITAPPDPAVYVMQAGQRRWIPDPQTFAAAAYGWDVVEAIPVSVMNTIPLGQQLPPVINTPGQDLIVDTGNVFLGAGHFMATRARLTRATGVVEGSTRTFTVTDLGGFHGGVYALLTDKDDIPVIGGQTPLYRYWVDGRWLGQSDRTDAWAPFHLDPAAAAAVQHFYVFHTWAPNDLATNIGLLTRNADAVAKLIQAAGPIAKIFTAVAG